MVHAPNNLHTAKAARMTRYGYIGLGDMGSAMAESTEWMNDSLGQDDFKEGVASFVERRPARFAPILVEE